MSTVVQSDWLNAVNGSYAVAANWSPAIIPTYKKKTATEYDVTLGGTATSGTAAFTVTSSANEQVGFLTVNANATLAISGGTFTVDSEVNNYSKAYNLGAIDVASGATVKFGAAGNPSNDSSEIWNTGAVTIAGTLRIDAPEFGLYGAGTFKLNGGTILGATTGGGNIFDNETDTITGSGTIGNGVGASGGAGLYLTNSNGATIDATAAKALTLDTGTNSIENAGTIETTGAGGLAIDSNMQQDGQLIASGKGALSVNNALVGGGTYSVLSGGTITLDNGQFGTGGIMTIAAGGTLTTTAGNTTGVGTNNAFAGDVLSVNDIENSGVVKVVDDSTLNFNSDIYGIGKITLGDTTGSAALEIFGGGSQLYATGGVVLSNDAANSILSNGAGEPLDNYATISGAGTIGDGFLRLDNQPGGVVNANDSVGLTIAGDGAAVAAGSESPNNNDGLVETTGAGGLTITGQFYNAGTLKAAGAGALTLNGAQIYSGGGIVETTGTGLIVLENNAGISHQADVSISAGGSLSTSTGDTSDAVEANVFNKGTINVASASTLEVSSIWQNSGSVNLNGASTATELEIEADSAWRLLGGGKVNLNGADSAIISGGAGTTLLNVNNSITGAGVIGDANMTVNNEAGATIDATGTSGLMLDASNTIYNAGTIESNSAGGLTIEAAMYSPGNLIANSGGDIVAEDAVSGPGLTTINGTGSITFGGENDSNVTFGAGGSGSLILEDSTQNYANIYGFGVGDTIDLRDFAYVSGSTQIDSTNSAFGEFDGTLVINNGSMDSAPLYLEGNYTPAYLTANNLAFQFSSDGHEIGSTGTFGTDVKLVSTG
jgi:hypothetical protein